MPEKSKLETLISEYLDGDMREAALAYLAVCLER